MDVSELKQIKKELIKQIDNEHNVLAKVNENDDNVYILIRIDSGGYRLYAYDKQKVTILGSNNRVLQRYCLYSYVESLLGIKILSDNNLIVNSFKPIVKDIINRLFVSAYYQVEYFFDIFRHNYKLLANLADLYEWGVVRDYRRTSIINFLHDNLKENEVNPKESNLKTVFGISPKALRIVADYPSMFNCDGMKELLSYGYDLNWIENNITGLKRIRSWYWNMKEAIEYMTNISDMHYWWYNDYLSMRAALPPELKKDFPIAPKDKSDEYFIKLHDKIVQVSNRLRAQKQAAELKELNDAYVKDVLPKVKKYEYSDDTYSIIACSELIELVYEGSTLGHCVGSYTDSVGHGREYILFLRKNEELDKPFYTVNITIDGKIRQIHGKRNCNVTKELEPFVNKWAKKFKLDASRYSGCLCHL